jgi:hypothetical protein
MSDARNSSGNIRGGGARQTGGAGRTSKSVGGGGSKKAGINGLTSSETIDKKLLARRNLQLITMSKKLAIEAQKAIFEESSEEEYKELNIPFPDPDMAMKKLKKMTKFTNEWHDAEFRERWLRSVLEVWTVELKEEYEVALRARKANIEARAKFERDKKLRQSGQKGPDVHAENDNDNENAKGETQSTEQLEKMLEDVNLSGEERKKIKKKLKKRKQRANKKKGDDGDDN